MVGARLSRTVGATLRHLQKAGLSLRVLAQDADVDPSLVTRIATGRRTATAPVAVALAEALERWAARCTKGARNIREGLAENPDF
jgi:plasmid maintenance system antidote protein VapI